MHRYGNGNVICVANIEGQLKITDDCEYLPIDALYYAAHQIMYNMLFDYAEIF